MSTDFALARQHDAVARPGLHRLATGHTDTTTDAPYFIGEVLFQGLETPDLFQDGADVVVEGTLAINGSQRLFMADNVLAKCPSKFEANAEVPQGKATSL